MASARPLSIAFVLPYGEPTDGFFPDALAGLLCERARSLGHRAQILRAYYHGRDARADASIRERVRHWLEQRDADLVVVERLFDTAPIRDHVSKGKHRTAILVTRGEPFESDGTIEWVVGLNTSPTRTGQRRSPEVGELVASFTDLLDRLSRRADPLAAPGVSRISGKRMKHGPPSTPAPLPRPLRPVLEQAVIAPGEAPIVRRKTIFGNSGCPYAADPLETEHYARIRVPKEPMARLGCAFCSMGGDYQKRPDASVVEELVEQARWYAEGSAEIEELVLSDQYALRYLAPLMEAASDLRPLRWLFPARADTFVRERPRIERAIDAARASGHRIEVYLSGFEAFCDRELARYNKGVTRAELLTAVDAMRELARTRSDAFDYARARGHSLILFNPWTSPEDVGETLEAVRSHGLADLFDEMGRNRLRLYDGLPITAAAERDGALDDRWDADDEGAGRRKGYSTERPWRFLDPRTRVLRRLGEALRERLGPGTEVAQLRAAVAFAESGGGDVARVLEELELLCAVLSSRTGGSHRDAAVARFAGACNNGCESCGHRDRYAPDDTEALLSRVDEARAAGLPVVLAGREPTVHPAFERALRRAAGEDRREVGIVTNGRRFAYPAFATACVRAGLHTASVKVFGVTGDPADRIARVEGGHAHALAGMQALRRAGVRALELRAPLHAESLRDLPRYAELASRLGADAIFVEAALDAIGLAHLGEAAERLEALLSVCDARGLPVETATLEAGAFRFDRLPTVAPRSRPAGRA